MKIEAGKYYMTRDGRKVGPIFENKKNNHWVWLNRANNDGPDMAWRSNGEGCNFNPVAVPCIDIDLISEWPAETGTLAELNVQPGDVVEYIGGGKHTVMNGRYLKSHKFGDINYYEQWDTVSNFRIISRATPDQQGPVRTVTRTTREIVPGVYGDVKVHDPGSKLVRINVDAAMDYVKLRAAAATLIEIADALEDK